jgi:assimilatory nitrate reductase catalytic subunit
MSTDTTCPYCGVGCGVRVTDGVVAGDPSHPANAGRLCSKGAALGETLSLEGRLLRPEVDGEAVGWDAALDVVADRFAQTIAEHGPDSVALYVSGQLLTEDYYAANKLAKGFLGTANIDSNSRLCMASAVAGHRRAFGEDLVPGVYEDLELADLLVLVGSNTAWCHPVVYQRIVAARAARPSMRLVVIDPRRTATCEGADLHLALRPGSDVALFDGLLAYLQENGFADDVFVAAHTSGAESALAAASGLDVAGSCGLAADDVATFYAWFAATPKVVTLFSQGVNQSSAGSDKANAIINAHLLTGRIGVPGAGPFSITGQPNAMGGREVGALANMLAAHLEWDRAGDAERLARFWQAPALAAKPGLKAVDLFQAIGLGKIRAVWIIATNPAVSMPASDAVRQALAACPFVVVSDCVRESDTMDAAHVRLPALAWGEKEGTVTNSERVISRQRAFLPAPGEARADWWAVAQVAARLGHGSAFGWRGPADIFREHAALSGLDNDGIRRFDISALAGLSDAGYAGMAPTRWPCPAGVEAPPVRMFGDGRFAHADGRARLVPTPPRLPVNATSARYPLTLNTGRLRDQWHTMTRTGKTARLMAHTPEPLVSVHPDDAAGLEDRALVWVAAVHGRAALRLRLDTAQRRGTVFAPMHWTDRFSPAGRINQAVNAAVDPVSGQPELKHTPVALRAFAADWHGFVLTRTRPTQELAAWWAVLPASADAWRTEIAGFGLPGEAFAALRAALAAETPWMQLTDAAAGVFRAAWIVDGRLEACIFLGREQALPARDWLVGCFAHDRLPQSARRALLAGAEPGGAVAEPPVCVCHGVGASAIAAAIAAGCDTVDAVGAATKAGTNCGSCRPEIRSALAALVPA